MTSSTFGELLNFVLKKASVKQLNSVTRGRNMLIENTLPSGSEVCVRFSRTLTAVMLRRCYNEASV